MVRKSKLMTTVLIVLTFLVLTGCKSDPVLSAYQEDMSAFSENIAAIDEKMKEIDPQSEDAVKELLSCLDSMKEEFGKLAEMEVPKQFASVESLADEAGTYMSEAVELYNNVFSTTPYDEYSSVLADESYKRAMKRIEYIGQILQGKTPEGDDIIAVTEESENGTKKQPESEQNQDTTGGEDIPTEDLLEE